MERLTDDQLLDAWRGGDADAGARLLGRHRAGIARFFVNAAGADAEDLVQATLLACAESLPAFRGDTSFRGYLYAIARRKLARHRRDDGRKRKYRAQLADLFVNTMPSALELLETCGQVALLDMAFTRLPAETQRMFTLHYWEAVRVADIAERVQLPVNTVKCRMRRGRLQLAKMLARSVS